MDRVCVSVVAVVRWEIDFSKEVNSNLSEPSGVLFCYVFLSVYYKLN